MHLGMADPRPPQPAYVLRGHTSPIHALSFQRRNSRLLTGDADGWVVVWSMATKRPVAVWKAHEGCMLDIGSWNSGEGVITHGKDNKLNVWKLTEQDEEGMSTSLPSDTPAEPRRSPWLLHSLPVNTLNFCAFAQCPAIPSTTASETTSNQPETLIAVPNTMISEAVDIFHLPSAHRIHIVTGPANVKTGMVMAVSLYHRTSHLTLLVGYESGHTAVFQETTPKKWQTLYLSHPHNQPVLSLSLIPSTDTYLTSSVDAIIAKHPIPPTPPIHSTTTKAGVVMETGSIKTFQTKHSGQQSLVVRSDARIFATAGWDMKARVYATGTMKEVAVLAWHREGCYAVTFAEVSAEDGGQKRAETEDGGGAGEGDVVRKGGIVSFRERRIRKAEKSHWLACGSKDGKVSLWDIY